MRSVELSKNSTEVDRLLDQARQEDLLVSLADGSEFLPIAIDEYDQEIARTRDNPRFMVLLEARTKNPSAIALDEVKRRLNLSMVG